jgi:hypothetical protein
MSGGPPAHLLDRQQAAAPPADTLDRVREAGRQLRDLQREAADLAERTRDVNKKINTLNFGTLPDLMAEARVDHVGLPAEGNMPACDLRLEKYTKANIAANWPEDKRARAFQVLDDMGLGSLVRITVTVPFDRGEAERARQLVELLDQHNYACEQDMDVPWNTLTAALKEHIRRHGLPGADVLQAIGASTGHYASLTERKED